MEDSQAKKELCFVPVDDPELVVGIVAPVGANLASVVDSLKREFDKANYKVEIIRVSALMHQLKSYESLGKKEGFSEFERIKNHMAAGTTLRTQTDRGDLMALLSIGQIRRIREQKNIDAGCTQEENNSSKPIPRTVYILRSLKHPEEIDTLKAVYGDTFIVVSAYSPREERVQHLAHALAKSENTSEPSKFRSKAEELICIDEKEEANKLGQNVSDAFPLADLFVDSRDKNNLNKSISRFLDYYFNYPYPSPTRDEFSMYIANAAALRSADLARQVGASITNQEGDIIAVGCNDIPKVGGGLYWIGDENDKRDFLLGYDSSSRYKNEILQEFIDKLKEANWLSVDKNKKNIDELLSDILEGDDKEVFDDAKIMDIIEFGRSVHAEMAAITDAAKRGIGTENATLYSTTFPCHLCARHIISSGICRVIYIQPYPKSQAENLYGDSIVVDPLIPVPGRVAFEPFVGISPKMFVKIFGAKGKRKHKITGETIEWDRANSNPKIKRFVLTYLSAEEVLIGEDLPRIMSENSLELVS